MNIVIHTGVYGSGDKGISHWSEFTEHLKLQTCQCTLPGNLLYILDCSFDTLFTDQKTRKSAGSFKARLAVAAILAVVLQLLITAKQFAIHYMLPSIFLTIPMVVLAGSLLMQMYPSQFESLRLKAIIGNWAFICSFISLRHSKMSLPLREARRKNQKESYLKFKEIRSHGPLIVSASYYGCSAVEYALTFGIHESGKYGRLHV